MEGKNNRTATDSITNKDIFFIRNELGGWAKV